MKKKSRFNERLVCECLMFGTALLQFLTAIVNAFVNYLRLQCQQSGNIVSSASRVDGSLFRRMRLASQGSTFGL